MGKPPDNAKLINLLNNLHLLPPETALKVLDLLRQNAESRERELAYAREHNRIILEQNGQQLERQYNLKIWSLIVSLIVTSFAMLGGIYLSVIGHENAGIISIVSGAGLSFADAIRKRAEKLFLPKEDKAPAP